MRDMLASTASFINCVGGTDGDNPTEITRSDVDTVVRTLRGNNAYSFLTGVEGEDRFGTAPVRDAYFGLGHTDLIGQLDNVAGFIAQTDMKHGRSSAVATIPDSSMATDAIGSPKGKRYVRDYSTDIAYLTAALQDVSAQLATMKNDLKTATDLISTLGKQ